MIIDAGSIEGGKTIKADLCIVGSGVAGITLANEFSQMDKSLVILESGGDELEDKVQNLYKGENTGKNYFKLEESRGRAVGGTIHFWNLRLDEENKLGVRFKELDSIDFEKRSWLPYSGWPFSKSELDKYYKRAKSICGIHENPELLNGEDTLPDNHFLHKSDKVEYAIYQCPEREFFLTDFLKEVKTSPNITLHKYATVLELHAAEDGKSISHVEVISTLSKKRYTVYADQFVLACGGIETPRLMLLSDSYFPNGIGNENDNVGRYFMEHPHLWSGAYYPDKEEKPSVKKMYTIHQNNGAYQMAKWILTEQALHKEKITNSAIALHYTPRLNVLRADKNLLDFKQELKSKKPGRNLLKLFLRILRDSYIYVSALGRRLFNSSYDEWYGTKYDGYLLNLLSEQAPNPESRVYLSDEKDSLGQRKVNLHWKVSKSDIQNILRAKQILNSELRKNGEGEIKEILDEKSTSEELHGGWHHMGTTRMHNDPKYGVCDSQCKVHGIDNLYVAGSSLFPTSGYANPTLTIMALSLRLADYLKNGAGKK